MYVPGEHNEAADALSRLETLPLTPLTPASSAELFGFEDDDLPADAFPLTYKLIMKHQLQDEELMSKAEAKDGYVLTTFHGGDKQRTLITKQGKIVMPKSLQKRCVDWYHHSLCHPGMTRTEQTIRQHFTWKNLRGEVKKTVKSAKSVSSQKRSPSSMENCLPK